MTFRTTLGVIGILLLSAGYAAAQPAGDAAKVVRSGFDEVSGHIMKAAELVPADKYTYQPTKDVRTFGQLLAHIIDGYNYFCAVGSGKKVEWSDAAEKGATDRATLTQKLKQATSGCQTVYGGSGNIGELIRNNEHTNLHYGNIITYLRMMGLKPPSS